MRRTIPQLREHALQSIASLKVSTEQEVIITDADRKAARAAGLTFEQMLGLEESPL